MGFDAVIVNPIMGKQSLKNLVDVSHKQNKGVISLCHMSAPEAKLSYEMKIKSLSKNKQLYQLFLDWAISSRVDGIIVGATYPKIISYCKNTTKNKLSIFSPGVGTQGGSPSKAKKLGSDFLIVGRTILNSKNPLETTKKLVQDSDVIILELPFMGQYNIGVPGFFEHIKYMKENKPPLGVFPLVLALSANGFVLNQTKKLT